MHRAVLPVVDVRFRRHDIHAAREGCGEGRGRDREGRQCFNRVRHPGHRAERAADRPDARLAVRHCRLRVSGLGVDYRGTDLDKATLGGVYPLIQGEYTQLQIMKFAPAVAVQPIDDLSLGIALHIDYASLDLRGGSSPAYGAGVQLGAIYALSSAVNLGVSLHHPLEGEPPQDPRLRPGRQARFPQALCAPAAGLRGSLPEPRHDEPPRRGGREVAELVGRRRVQRFRLGGPVGVRPGNPGGAGEEVFAQGRVQLREEPSQEAQQLRRELRFSNPEQPVPDSINRVQGRSFPPTTTRPSGSSGSRPSWRSTSPSGPGTNSPRGSS
ncbi:MAG: hypothetical protein MZV64_31820 [Ignavibacteriales bacterium]|nr:hypothetical protein [Ignavibacteriales bacterium]